MSTCSLGQLSLSVKLFVFARMDSVLSFAYMFEISTSVCVCVMLLCCFCSLISKEATELIGQTLSV